MITARSLPRCSSSGTKSRPSSGRWPTTEKALAVMYVPRACSGMPRSSLMFMLPPVQPPSPLNAFVWPRHSLKSTNEMLLCPPRFTCQATM